MPDDAPRALPAFFRTADTWLCYALLGYFSYFVNALGPLMPFVRADLGLSYTLASLHFTAFAGGRVLAGLAIDRLIARLGRRPVAWGGAFGSAAGAMLLLLGRHPAVTIAGTAVMGVMGASIPIIIQAALADRHGSLRGVAFAEANTLASGVAMLAPLAIGFFARTALGWRAALVLAVAALVPMFAGFRGYAFAGAGRRKAGEASAGALPVTFWAYWAVLLLVVAAEFCIVYWAAGFLEQAKGLARADAALSTTVFGFGMFAGRFLGSRILRRTQNMRMLFLALALAGAGFLLHWRGEAVWLTEGGLLLAGLGVANLYPLGLTFAMNTAPGQADVASARAALAVALAILTLPLLLGRMADVLGIGTAYGLVAVLLGLAVLATVLARALDLARARRTAGLVMATGAPGATSGSGSGGSHQAR